MVVSALGARLAPPKMTLKQYSYLSLVVVYTSSMTFLMKKSRAQSSENEGLYSIPTSIFLAEVLKLIVSIAIEQSNRQTSVQQYKMIEEQSDTELEGGLVGRDKSTAQNRGNTREKLTRSSSSSSAKSVAESTGGHPQETGWNTIIKDVLAPDCWKLSIPAALYVAQSLLQMVAIQSVSAVTYQAVTQCKLLATTLLSVWLLSRLYSQRQWISIFVLLIGVVMVSVSKIKETSLSTSSSFSASSSFSTLSSSQQSQDAIVAAKLLGVLGVLAACTLGSGAAVYMEKVLKSDVKTSLWIRNAQLSLFSLIPAAFAVFYESSKKGEFPWQHPLQYFGYWAWSTVIARSIGGFLIAFILKQTDALLKGIATSIAMVLSIFAESLLYDVPISPSFAFGAFLVVASSGVYVRSGLKA